MSLKLARLLLFFATGILLALTCAIFVWGFSAASNEQLTTNLPTTNEFALTEKVKITSKKSTSLMPSELWDRQLRRPLYDPPPPAPAPLPTPPPPNPIQAKLWATMIDQDHADKSLAVIRLNSGEEVFRKTGQVIGGADGDVEILEISAGSIRVRRGQDVQELEVKYDQ